MQVPADRLLEQLAAGKPLASFYFVYGDEPLQATELVDALRMAAQAAGASERLVINIDAASDWATVQGEQGAMSLFAERRLIEIRLGTRKPDKAGTELLSQLLTAEQQDDIYLLTAAKPDSRVRKSKWFKLLEQHAVNVNVRDLPMAQLPTWLNRRAARFQKRLTDDAVRFIADRVEGNLLAAAQEVEKLCLTVSNELINVDDVLDAVTDSARYDVFQLADAMVGTELPRAIRVLRGLREEGTEPVLAAWALGRELRELSVMADKVAAGQQLQQVLDQHRVWNNRKSMVGRALNRLGATELGRLRVEINRIDMGIKGARMASPWDELEWLLLRFCGADKTAVAVT